MHVFLLKANLVAPISFPILVVVVVSSKELQRNSLLERWPRLPTFEIFNLKTLDYCVMTNTNIYIYISISRTLVSKSGHELCW